MQEEWESIRKRLNKDLENTNEKYSDLELKYKCDLNEQLKENEQLNELIKSLKYDNNKLNENIK